MCIFVDIFPVKLLTENIYKNLLREMFVEFESKCGNFISFIYREQTKFLISIILEKFFSQKLCRFHYKLSLNTFLIFHTLVIHLDEFLVMGFTSASSS